MIGRGTKKGLTQRIRIKRDLKIREERFMTYRATYDIRREVERRFELDVQH